VGKSVRCPFCGSEIPWTPASGARKSNSDKGAWKDLCLAEVGNVEITPKRLITAGVVLIVLIVIFRPIVAPRAVVLKSVQPVTAFAAIKGVQHRSVPMQIVQGGAGEMDLGGEDSLVVLKADPAGDCLQIELGLACKWLVHEGFANEMEVQISADLIRVTADGKALPFLLLGFQYDKPPAAVSLLPDLRKSGMVPSALARTRDSTTPLNMHWIKDIGSSVFAPPTPAPPKPEAETADEMVDQMMKDTPTGRTWPKRGQKGGPPQPKEFKIEGPGGIEVDYAIRDFAVEMIWPPPCQAWQSARTIYDMRGLLSLGRLKTVILCPRPAAGTNEIEVRIADRTIDIPARRFAAKR